MDLRYALDEETSPKKHPQIVMRELGITYALAVPQSLFDSWWFWRCENVPTPLPGFLRPLGIEPKDGLGRGMSQEHVEMLEKLGPIPTPASDPQST